MPSKYQNWIQFKLINFGIALLPQEFRNERFIRSCMKTGHIKVVYKEPSYGVGEKAQKTSK